MLLLLAIFDKVVSIYSMNIPLYLMRVEYVFSTEILALLVQILLPFAKF